MPNLIRVLSIDGGGIRGLIPGQVLVELERLLQEKTREPQARIADYFDLIAGTSTGGILTCLYLFPDLKSNRPSFSAPEVVNAYLELGPQVFKRPGYHRILSLGGLVKEKYPSSSMEKQLKTLFGDLSLRQLLKPCLIPAYNIEKRYAHFFTKHDAETDPDYDFRIRDVVRATAAAPSYFTVAGVQSLKNTFFPLIDGGVFANNPALCAYTEVYRTFKNAPSAANMVICSLGTGQDERPLNYRRAKNWGTIGWTVPLFNILMSGNPETVDYELKTIFDSVNRSTHYLRINPILPNPLTRIDNTSTRNMQALVDLGQKTAAEFRARLSTLAELLIANSNQPQSLISPKYKLG